MKEIKYINFKNGVDFLIKNQPLLIIFSFLEFIPVFIKAIDTSFFFITYINPNLHITNSLRIISSYYHLHKYISKLSSPTQPIDTCIIMSLITFIYLLPHFFFYINPSFGSSLFKRVIINLQDIFISKIFFIHCK